MEGNIKIAAIPNRYKNIFDNFIDSSNTKFPNWPRPIDKKSRNVFKSRGNLMGLLKKITLIKIFQIDHQS